jgi:hypothetical protein
MSLINLIQDYRWLVLLICLPLLFIYGRVLYRAAFGASTGASTSKPTLTRPPTVPLRKLPPKPGSQIKPPSNSNLVKGPALPPEGRQEVLPQALGAGVAEHQKAGVAKTVKLPNVTPKPTDAPAPKLDARIQEKAEAKNDDSINQEMDGLFGTRDNAPAATPAVSADKIKTEITKDNKTEEKAPAAHEEESNTGAIRRKAGRLQELGFHHSIATDDLKKTAASSATPITAPSSTVGTPETPRSSTAELTSILERIDKFLAEDTSDVAPTSAAENNSTNALTKSTDKPAAQNNPAPAEATDAQSAANKKTQPLWARADVTDDDLSADNKNDSNKKTDSGQQRLF